MTTETNNLATQVDFIVRIVSDKTRNGEPDWSSFSDMRTEWHQHVNKFYLDNAERFGIVTAIPITNDPEPIVVPADRRRRSDFISHFTMTAQQLLDLWNRNFRFISLSRNHWNDEQLKENDDRIRKMRGSVVSITQHAFRGNCATLQEIDHNMLIESGILQQMRATVQEAVSMVVQKELVKMVDAWFDGELEDGLIARVREELVNSAIDEYLRGGSPTQPEMEPF